MKGKREERSAVLCVPVVGLRCVVLCCVVFSLVELSCVGLGWIELS